MVTLFGAARDGVPVYGSGGFTSCSVAKLQQQLGGWSDNGIARLKMKIGRDPERDIERLRAAHEAIGPGTELFVDANGAYSRKQALAMAEAFDEFGVSWFEEPVVRHMEYFLDHARIATMLFGGVPAPVDGASIQI